LAGVVGGPVSHVVDAAGLVRLAIGVNHRGIGPQAGETFFRAMLFFVTVPADDVGVAGVAVVGLAIVTRLAMVVLGGNRLLQARSAATCLISC